MTDTHLLEASFLDLIAAIEHSTELSISTRRHWACSTQRIAQWLDRRAETIPARLVAIRIALGQLHHARLGVTAKTLANHRANVRAALRWFQQEKGACALALPLSSEWERLRNKIGNRGERARLSAMMRFCSTKGISPEVVDDAVLASYMRYRAEYTAMAANTMAQRSIARTWNACCVNVEGWPQITLTEPQLRAAEGLPWESFPERLRQDIDDYIATLQQKRRGRNGKRIRANKPSSIETRRAEIVALVRIAVRQGVKIEDLCSLAKLLHPDVVERVIEAYWAANGKEPSVYTIDLAWKLLMIARATGCLDQGGLERLDEIRADLEHYRRVGLTLKNMQLVRQVLTEGVWSEVVSLPYGLMAKAQSLKYHAPVKAAVTAQLSVAIAILTHAPIRLANLVSIRLDDNLIKPGGFDTPYWLKFPRYDVKNHIDLDFAFDQQLTQLIDEYVREFRLTLLRGSNAPLLFPGENGEAKTAKTLSDQITERILKATGLRITVHQFRHAAAAIYLKYRPGEYETVRRFLGHKKIQTTINFYCGLQTTHATEALAKIVHAHVKFEPEFDHAQ
jgi:integrase